MFVCLVGLTCSVPLNSRSPLSLTNTRSLRDTLIKSNGSIVPSLSAIVGASGGGGGGVRLKGLNGERRNGGWPKTAVTKGSCSDSSSPDRSFLET